MKAIILLSLILISSCTVMRKPGYEYIKVEIVYIDSTNTLRSCEGFAVSKMGLYLNQDKRIKKVVNMDGVEVSRVYSLRKVYQDEDSNWDN